MRARIIAAFGVVMSLLLMGIAAAVTTAGRDPAAIGMEGQLKWNANLEDLTDRVQRWRAAGATHLSLNTMAAGLATPNEHLDALASAAEVLRSD